MIDSNFYTSEQLKNWMDTDEKYSIYINYPPFTISSQKREEYKADIVQEEGRIGSKMNAGDEDAFDRMFSTVEVKWKDDLDEARLYQKRYGMDYDGMVDAFEAALEVEGLDEDSPGVPFGVL